MIRSRCSTFSLNHSVAVAEVDPKLAATTTDAAPSARAVPAAEAVAWRESAKTEASCETTTEAVPRDSGKNSHEAGLGSLSVSASVVQEVHVCATHKKPRLLIKFIEG